MKCFEYLRQARRPHEAASFINYTARRLHEAFSYIFILMIMSCVTALHAQDTKAMPDFAASFTKLQSNRDFYQLYQDSVRTNLNDEEWIAFMDRRSSVLQQLYFANNSLIDEITDYFDQNENFIQVPAYDSLFFWCKDMFTRDYGDTFLLEEFTDILLPHYEALADTSRLLMLHHIAGNCDFSITRSFDPSSADKALSHYRRIIGLGSHFESIDPEYSWIVPKDYVTLCYHMSALEAMPAHEALELTDEFEAFLSRYGHLLSEEYRQTYSSMLERIRATAFRIHSGNAASNGNEADSLALIKMYEASPFKHATLADLEDPEDSIYYYHLHALMDHINIDTAYWACDQILVRQLESFARLNLITDEDILVVANNMIATMTLMDMSGISDNQKTQRALFYTYRVADIVQRARIADSAAFYDYVLSELANEPTIIKHLPANMKEQFLYQLAVKFQIGSVVHVNMVENLCMAVLDGLLNDCPEEFVGVMGYSTVEEVLSNRSALMRYMSMAALFHDIGKIQISEIVDNDFRRLTKHEIAIFCNHPERALEYLSLDPVFDKYKDVALGHHKWYNGKGGYPASFDNVSSPWRPFIDLLSLCDGIDGATDNMGRNYRKAKSLSVLLEEFKSDAGVRYNPVMVKALIEDEALLEKVNHIIVTNRRQHLNYVRSRYILNSK